MDAVVRTFEYERKSDPFWFDGVYYPEPHERQDCLILELDIADVPLRVCTTVEEFMQSSKDPVFKGCMLFIVQSSHPKKIRDSGYKFFAQHRQRLLRLPTRLEHLPRTPPVLQEHS